MAVKTQRYLDAQGRIILPNHIRKALNLNAGSVVEVDMDTNGTIRIKPSSERCTICGEGLDDVPHATIKIGSTQKHICENCANLIRYSVICKSMTSRETAEETR